MSGTAILSTRMGLGQARATARRASLVAWFNLYMGRAAGANAETTIQTKAREVLDKYLHEVRGRQPGPLFCSRSRKPLARQNVDSALKAVAKQANIRLPDDQKIKLHAHVLRHTCLRRAAERHGVQYVMELSDQSSERYIGRYVQPSRAPKEAALNDPF